MLVPNAPLIPSSGMLTMGPRAPSLTNTWFSRAPGWESNITKNLSMRARFGSGPGTLPGMRITGVGIAKWNWFTLSACPRKAAPRPPRCPTSSDPSMSPVRPLRIADTLGSNRALTSPSTLASNAPRVPMNSGTTAQPGTHIA